MDIIIENMSKNYGKYKALQGISMHIEQGMFGLLGPNGAGKTTLLRVLATLLHPTSGRVQIGQYDLSQSKQRKEFRSYLGYMPQEVALYPDLTGHEFLDYMGLLKHLYDRTARRQQIATLLDTVNLTDQAKRSIKTYSGGMKRRLGIAQALLGNPQVLIIDEPTAGLDPEERIRLRTLLTRVAEDRVVLLSTHVVEDISQTCEHIAVLNQGRVVFNGQTRQLIEAATGHVWQFLATPGYQVPAKLSVISTQQQLQGILYHVVGSQPEGPIHNLQHLSPTLEDGYIWLRHLISGENTISMVVNQ